MNNYVCYHLHTELSLLDSCTNHKLYADKAAELGQSAICYSEHGNLYNWIEKKMYANSKGLKYLHGCEVYLTASFQEKVRDNYHTILIAKNYVGFKELNLLVQKSTQPDHFYYKPRISFDEFLGISDNIIRISACLASPLRRYPKSENADKELFLKLLKKYNYLEVQPHVKSLDQIEYNIALAKTSKQFNIPLIAGTDTHSIDSYKAECRSILQKAKNIEFSSEDDFDLTYKSYDELVEMFKQQGALTQEEYMTAINNTNIMANSVEDFELDTAFKYPILYDNEEEVFKQRINQMYMDKVKRGVIQHDLRYKEMVQEEMRVFKKIGMVGFMLFMSELVCWCWENNIPVGFCRGSVGGSMIAYLTDIIDVNPLRWGTMFSRFANEDRKEIGDIDLDISPSQRQKVYDHIIEEYGESKTAYVLAIGTISDKGTIDDIARALSKQDVLKDKYSLANTKIIKQQYEEDPEQTKNDYPELFYYFDGLVNTAISQSMHPAGIIVSPISLPDNYGVFWNDNKQILNINMEEIHEVSLVKYDLLGLKNIEIIKDTCELAHIQYPKSHEINWDDNNVWEHIADSPVGIFQMESRFAYDSMKKMNCHSVNDLSLVNSCIRPSGESYRDRLLAGEWNKNPSELIDDVLSASRGFLAYQEQVISFLQNVCGLSGSEADNVRRAIGRKQMDRLYAALPRILEGYCNKSDKSREEAEEEAKTFLQIIEDSSNYMFGFNHSTGYSMIGYTCAYLRYYYPVEFTTAYLNNANNDDDITNGTELAHILNITIENIKFRHSVATYTCDSDKRTIYKGLSSIKYLSDSAANDLYALKNNVYDNFIQLLIDLKNTSCDARQLDILIKLDFFSEFGNPNQLLAQVKMFNDIYGKKQFKKDKCEIPERLMKKYAGKETEKMYTQVDTTALMYDLAGYTDEITTSLIERLKWSNELLGYLNITKPNWPEAVHYVQVIDGNWITLYRMKDGYSFKIKTRKAHFNKNKFSEGQLIKILEITQENKYVKTANGEWGRSDELEDILKSWSIIKER